MNAGELGGWIGAIVGCLCGIAGGAIGTYYGLRNTKGPLERKYAVKASVVGWLAFVIFLILMLTIPRPYNALLWVPYAIFLPMSIKHVNKTCIEIRKNENAEQAVPEYAAQSASSSEP